MADGSATPGSSFARVYEGALACDAGALDAPLAACWERGRGAWPDVDLDPAALAAWLGARAPAEEEPLAWLPGVDAASAYLACACAERLPRALRAFEAAYLGKLDLYLHRLHPTPELVMETRQELLRKLFVGTEAKPPKIRQYRGKGALEGWVRVAALRVALNLRKAERTETEAHDTEEVARAIAPGPDPELAFMKETYRAELVAAFREAFASLPGKDRNLLRFAFVERLTPARVGAIYGVHRTTAMRWIEAAQEEVLSRTRARLSARLRLTPSECDDIFALVQSRIEVTLGSLLQTA
jgi:RNA polymerase sigma-70 factor (ECF subfamily)